MNGRAKYVNRLVNRTNVCGGDNKAGLPSRIGAVSNRLAINCNTVCGLPKMCVIKKHVRMNYRAGRKYLG
jgi:hypothetical protein